MDPYKWDVTAVDTELVLRELEHERRLVHRGGVRM